jgi:hypothetical protein
VITFSACVYTLDMVNVQVMITSSDVCD